MSRTYRFQNPDTGVITEITSKAKRVYKWAGFAETNDGLVFVTLTGVEDKMKALKSTKTSLPSWSRYEVVPVEVTEN